MVERAIASPMTTVAFGRYAVARGPEAAGLLSIAKRVLYRRLAGARDPLGAL